MRGNALKIILNKAQTKGFKLQAARALEMFAREGDWQAFIYGNRVLSLEGWEEDMVYKRKFLKLFPKALYRITNSILECKKSSHRGKYNLLVIDDPQNCYGPKRKYCEHFDFLNDAIKMLDGEGLVVFNVNLKPYDYELYPDWQNRRLSFYKKEKLSISWLKGFYNKFFSKYGFNTLYSFTQLRRDNLHNNIYLFAYYLKMK